MAYDTDSKSSAELQRELEQQRHRVENTIDQIQQKLSPGQLVDELLAYTKGGGGEFVASLQRNVTANPLPVALLGVSLAWLMAKPGTSAAESRDDVGTIRADRHWDDSINDRRGYTGRTESDEFDEYYEYPVTVIAGDSLQRLGTSADEHGSTYSEFADDAGRKFKALSDASGRRAGHFIDEAGNRYKGFTNAAGDQVQHFRDESGTLLEEASGWASHTWQKAREKLHDARDALGAQAGAGQRQAGHARDAVRGQVENLNQTIINQFRDQPLVGGALAFALGAALGSALPPTEQEDAVLGETADRLKAKAAGEAASLYEDGKDKLSELHGAVTERGGELYQEVKDGITQAVTNSETQERT